jgi:gamma-glutamylputrescine oxidase
MHQEVAARQPTATPVYVIDHGECEELLEMRIDETFLGGRWMPRAAMVHPTRFVYGLADAAMHYGARVAQRTAALRIEQVHRGEGIEVETPRGRVRARHVVLACNARTGRLWHRLRKIITPLRGQMLSSRPMRPIFRIGLAVDWGAVYWRQTTDGVIVLGGYRGLDPVAETSAREALNPRIQSALSCFLPESFPGFPAVAVCQRWSGIMDQTADGKPIIGRWPDTPNIWIIAGFGGHGLPPALGVGEALAQAIVYDRHATELDPFNPARFKGALRC